MKRSGHTIIEVVMSIGILAVATVSVGSLIDSLRTTDRATTNKAHASALAQQTLEIASAITHQEFVRPKPCGSYNPPSGYDNCWAVCPTVSGCSAEYHISNSAPRSLVAGIEQIPADEINKLPSFTRALTITPIDADGQVKKLTATVSWQEKNRSPQVVVSTIVSAWHD